MGITDGVSPIEDSWAVKGTGAELTGAQVSAGLPREEVTDMPSVPPSLTGPELRRVGGTALGSEQRASDRQVRPAQDTQEVVR